MYKIFTTIALWSIALSVNAQQFSFYKSGESHVQYAWDVHGDIHEISTDQPYEGNEHLRFNYNFNNWWAGFGLGTGGINLTPYTHIRVAYRGLSNAGEHLFIQFNGGVASLQADLGAFSANYKIVEIPIWQLVGDTQLQVSEITEIAFAIVGVQDASGTVYIDNIEFITLPANPIDAVYKNGVNLITGSWGTPGPIEQTNNSPYEGGQHIVYGPFDFEGASWAGFGLNLNNWGTTAPLDFAQHTTLRFAWRGLDAGYRLRVRLVSGGNYTDWLTVASGPATSYMVVDVPLNTLVDASNVSLHAITGIDFGIENGTPEGSGGLFLDALELVGSPGQGSSVVLANTRAGKMGFGVNLSNWLEAYWLGNNYPAPHEYTRNDLAYLAAIGVKTIRMPVIFERIASSAPYTIPPQHAALKLADSVVAWTNALGLNLIIDNHHGIELNNQNWETEIPRKCAVWKQIMQRYGQLNPEKVFFELYNEPTAEISNLNFRKVAKAMIDSIRAHDPLGHTLIVGGNYWNSASSLASITPYPDTNLIYTFHSYAPWAFCNQGLTWVSPYIDPNVLFPLPGDENDLLTIFRTVNNWSAQHHVPVFLGEFASSAIADPESRCRWMETYAALSDSFNIPVAYWDVKHWNDAYGWFSDGVIHAASLETCLPEAFGLNQMSAITEPGTTAAELVLAGPNPFDDAIQLNFRLPYPESELRIFDLTGRQVQAIMIPQKMAGETQTVTLSGLPAGVYVAQLQGAPSLRWKWVKE